MKLHANRRWKQALLTTASLSVGLLPTAAFAKPAEVDASPQPAQSDASPQPAQSDASPQPGTTTSSDNGSSDIVVTGSLIKNPNLTTSSPVSVVSAEEIQFRQPGTAEELLRTLPSNVADNGTAVNNGNNGSSYINLRGLGSGRNVVLLDGARITPSRANSDVDLNNIPLALIERVDALTGGAVTTYGADAVTGVVNFITRKNFSGVEFDVSNRLTERGDGEYFRGDVILGANFNDNRGNVVLSAGYQKSEAAWYSNRDFAVQGYNSFSGAPVGSADSLVPRFQFTGVSGARELNSAGQLVPASTTFNANPFGTFQTPFQRFNAYAAGHYELTNGVEFYTRAMFSRNFVRITIDPAILNNTSVTIPISNPFLSDAARASFCSTADFNPGVAGVQTLTSAQCAAAAVATSASDPNFRTFTASIRGRVPETGLRLKDFTTNFFDIRAGFRGSITPSLNWDLWGSYGRNENNQSVENFIIVARLRQALLATNPNTCLDPSNGCVPANIFRLSGGVSPAAAAFLVQDNSILNAATLLQARGTISGDFGWSSPWAVTPISFALGAEYRKYRALTEPDALASAPSAIINRNAAPPPLHGTYNVREAFAELNAPLVENKPFFELLSLEAGVRYSHYAVSLPTKPTFNTTTYKLGATWAPGGGLRFRGSYARAVRAPNVGDLFTTNRITTDSIIKDYCAGAAPTANADLRAICLAQGAPPSSIGAITLPPNQDINLTFGGNPNVKPEKADTYTAGFVYRPSYVPGLALTLDYYKIKINGAIGEPSAQDAYDACFHGGNVTSASASDLACLIIRRNPVSGELFGDQSTTPGVFAGQSNAGKLSTRGFDLTLNYRRPLGFATLYLDFMGNYTVSQKFNFTPSSSLTECTGYYSTNCPFSESLAPKIQWTQRTTLEFRKIDLSLNWRHIGSLKQEPATAVASPAFQGTIPALGQQNFRRTGAYDVFDLSTRFRVTRDLALILTVQNLFDRDPPLVGQGIGFSTFNVGNTYPSTFDALGRRYTVAARLKF